MTKKVLRYSHSIFGIRYGKFSEHCLQNTGCDRKAGENSRCGVETFKFLLFCPLQLAMSGLLSPHGVIIADNSLCSLVYDEEDERRQRLHDFNRRVKNDPRVEQVVLTIREGISLIRPIQ